jgi:hypothetical protein
MTSPDRCRIPMIRIGIRAHAGTLPIANINGTHQSTGIFAQLPTDNYRRRSRRQVDEKERSIESAINVSTIIDSLLLVVVHIA